MASQSGAGPFNVENHTFENREQFQQFWFQRREALGPKAAGHSSSPAVWINDDTPQFIGGCDDTLAWLKQNYSDAPGARKKRASVVHSNDMVPIGRGDYDYDLIVIGGGSGGLAASKEAAKHGAKVMLLDYVKPSWQGTTWGLGGTCVNVGCIPKKMMHQGALLGEYVEDAKSYGWEVPEKGQYKHDWLAMVNNVQDRIKGLNFGYRVSLRESKVEYKNALGAFKDPHTIVMTDKKGNTTEVTARRFLIAVGGRPRPLDIPGGELAISSDDLFSMKTPPGKTLVIGASYVALECAGFVHGFGYDTTVMVRSILLRGFDSQCAEMIGDYMANQGIKFVRKTVPTKIEKTEDGKLRVHFKNTETNEEGSEVYDTVFTATGRVADTHKLNLEAAGVKSDSNGKIPAENEQTNVPHIYAVGDVLSGRPELTPVAIHAGRKLARRLYNNQTAGMDYKMIPTTVFTPIEYGTVGYSEDDAMKEFGEDDIEVYHGFFTPLEWTVTDHRSANCYAKIIVRKSDMDRVIGFHIVGPHAGEITQGWAAAVRMGATYDDFVETIGIHPTISEEFTTLFTSKSSGENALRTGC